MEEHKIDKGIFNFLIKRGAGMSEMRRILALYALSKGHKRPKKNKFKWYSEMSTLAQTNFTEFKKFYNKNKLTFVRSQSYDEWYEECSMDGSFAYNGSADDF